MSRKITPQEQNAVAHVKDVLKPTGILEKYQRSVLKELSPEPMGIVERLEQYATSWSDRAGDATPVHAAIAEITKLRAALIARETEAEKIVAEFESIFGSITATERRWLTRRFSGQEV
jgi:hypothetical protein